MVPAARRWAWLDGRRCPAAGGGGPGGGGTAIGAGGSGPPSGSVPTSARRRPRPPGSDHGAAGPRDPDVPVHAEAGVGRGQPAGRWPGAAEGPRSPGPAVLAAWRRVDRLDGSRSPSAGPGLVRRCPCSPAPCAPTTSAGTTWARRWSPPRPADRAAPADRGWLRRLSGRAERVRYRFSPLERRGVDRRLAGRPDRLGGRRPGAGRPGPPLAARRSPGCGRPWPWSAPAWPSPSGPSRADRRAVAPPGWPDGLGPGHRGARPAAGPAPATAIDWTGDRPSGSTVALRRQPDRRRVGSGAAAAVGRRRPDPAGPSPAGPAPSAERTGVGWSSTTGPAPPPPSWPCGATASPCSARPTRTPGSPAWARVLAALAREGSDVHRIQWIESCLPDDGGAVRRHWPDHAVLGRRHPGRPLLPALVDESAPVTRRHQVLVALSVRAVPVGPLDPGAGRGPDRHGAVLPGRSWPCTGPSTGPTSGRRGARPGRAGPGDRRGVRPDGRPRWPAVERDAGAGAATPARRGPGRWPSSPTGTPCAPTAPGTPPTGSPSGRGSTSPPTSSARSSSRRSGAPSP